MISVGLPFAANNIGKRLPSFLIFLHPGQIIKLSEGTFKRAVIHLTHGCQRQLFHRHHSHRTSTLFCVFMAVVVDSISEVREYFEENGTDISDMSDEELEEASEVFALPGGQYLIVEG